MNANGITGQEARTEFLQLLVTQLRNQDPLDPLKQHDFLGQLAQFSTLESVESLNANFSDMLRLQELSQGTNMLGRTISYSDPVDGSQTEGVVEAMLVKNDQLLLSVNGALVPIDEINAIVA